MKVTVGYFRMIDDSNVFLMNLIFYKCNNAFNAESNKFSPSLLCFFRYIPSLSQRGDPLTTSKINVILYLLSILENSDQIESFRTVNLEMMKY